MQNFHLHLAQGLLDSQEVCLALVQTSILLLERVNGHCEDPFLDVVRDGSGTIPYLEELHPKAPGTDNILTLCLADVLTPTLLSPLVLLGAVGAVDGDGLSFNTIHHYNLLCHIHF